MTQATQSLKTLLLVFFSTVLGLLVTGGADVLSLQGWSDWRPYVAAGIAAVLTYAYNFLNPADPRYGIVK